jgi:DNA-binding CsgD family transcriptional regulator
VSQGFVGRAEELAAIEELLADARRERRASALLVVGEPGMGKSRLLAEAEDRHRDGSILRFAGYEPESTVPLAAAAPLLRRIAAASEDRNFHGLLESGAETGGLDAIRIFESVHRQLARLQPAALFVDDLQWVDPVSLALCHYLVRAVDGSGRGLALVTASRPTPTADQFATSLAAVLGEDRRPGTLHLRPLDRTAGVRFVMDRTGSIDRRHAVDLWERAGGSPFWLDVLVDARGDDTDIDAVVGARIATLSADGKHLLSVLAVLGRPSDAIELERLLGWPAERTSAAIHAITGRGLAVAGSGAIRLAHDLIRDGVVTLTDATTRRRLHAHIATVLERDAGGDAPRLLAVLEHRAAAGSFDPDLALRILASPQRRLIGSDGVRRIAESGRELDDNAMRVSVDEAAAALADELGDQALALDLWARVAGGTTDEAIAARAEFGAARSAYHLGRRDDARHWLRRSRARSAASAALDITSDALDARILLWLEHQTDDGRVVALRGVERGRAVIDGGTPTREERAAYLDALIAAWEAAIQSEHVDEVLALADDALDASKAIGLREVIEARSMIGLALEYAADQHEAVATYRQVWDDAWRAVLPVEAVDVGYRLASVLFDVLDLTEATRVATETDRLAARVGDQGRVRDRTRLITYQLAMLTSDWRSAADAILAAGAEEPDPHYGLRYPLAVAVWLARLGIDGDDAITHADTARRLAATAGCVACRRDTDVAIAEVYARFDRIADAKGALARWDAVGRPSWLESEWQRRRAGVLVDTAGASVAGDPERLESALTQLRDDADAEGFALNALWTELDMGRLLAPHDRAGAATAYRRAAARAQGSGATTIQRVAEQSLRALGERTWRRGRAIDRSDALGALSAREREVAGFVAAGATNAEIATRLFLSPKTVEHHVSNALSKLGLHSRTELAARVGEASRRPDREDGATPP